MPTRFTPNQFAFNEVNYDPDIKTLSGAPLYRATANIAMRDALNVPTAAAIFAERALDGTYYTADGSLDAWAPERNGHLVDTNEYWIVPRNPDSMMPSPLMLNHSLRLTRLAARTQVAMSSEYPGLIRFHRNHDIGDVLLRAISLTPGVLNRDFPGRYANKEPSKEGYYHPRRLLEVLVDPGFSLTGTRDRVHELLEY